MRYCLLMLSAVLCCLPVRADMFALMTDFPNDQFGRLDLSTGVFTPIASQSSSISGMGFTSVGTLYGTSGSLTQAEVFQIDPITGVLTSLGTVNQTAVGSTVGPDSLIYGMSLDANAQFYTINPSGLATNTISSLGFASDGLAAFDGGQFYTDQVGGFVPSDILERVDPTTGAATQVGTGLGLEAFAGALAGGTLYGVGQTAGVNQLFTIDVNTGLATLVADITGLPDGAEPFSLAFNNNAAVPEPSSLPIAALAVLTIGLIRMRRRQAQ